MHLMIDGRCSNTEKLASTGVVEDFLLLIPEVIGMKVISAAHTVQYQSPQPGQRGVTGFVIVAESHIAIHTWPEHLLVWVDVFSCRDFDVGKVERATIQAFGIRSMRMDVLPRGLKEGWE